MKAVKMSEIEMNIEEKADFWIAVNKYKREKREKWSDGTDFVVSDVVSDEKVLLRLVTPQSRSESVGAEDVKNMLGAMKHEYCSRGVLIGKRFTDAATQEMSRHDIQQVSDEYMPPIKTEDIFLTINEFVDYLCRIKCGAVPLKESDCKSRLEESICKVRSISDNASFHFERGWSKLLRNDFRQLVLLNKSH
jgi:hypothetical protein